MKKKILMLGLTLMMLFGATMTASAANECFCITIYHLTPASVSYSCQGEKDFAFTESHRYGFTWKECYFRVYQSSAKEFCSRCGYIYSIGGPHECEFRHESCDRGVEKVCLVGYSVPTNPYPYGVEEEKETE